MFERFTDRSRRTVVLAQEEARMLNHGYIGTEHLLLGLIHEGGGVAAQSLEAMGISLEAVRQQIETIIGRGKEPASGHIPFTPRAKRVLELSLRESSQLGHDYIGTEHILLGLIREGHGVAAKVLVALGADLNRVRQQVIKMLHDRGGEGPPGKRRSPGARAMGGGVIDDVFARIDSVDQRLASLERWVGMGPVVDEAGQDLAQLRHEKESAIDAQDFETAAALRDKEKRLLEDQARKEMDRTAATGDRRSLAEDFARLSAELGRLRALLREHGIGSGDGAA
jgi:ATP-dependent Clp protease ATP-binding subunit ClpC